MPEGLHQQSDASLRHLAVALRAGLLSGEMTATALSAVLGAGSSSLAGALADLQSSDFTPPQIAVLCESILRARHHNDDLGRQIELIISGPDTPGIPTGDTAATMHALVTEATQEIMIVGYAVYQGRRLFAPIAERLRTLPNLRVKFCLNIARPWGDTTRTESLVTRFAEDFFKEQWPWTPRPQIWYDPRSVEPTHQRRASLHAKAVIVDRAVALVTSANFTEAAQLRNIEVGLMVRHPPLASRLANYFDELHTLGILRTIQAGNY